MPHYALVDTSNSTRIKNKNKTVVKILIYTQIIKSQESIILPTPTPMFLLNSRSSVFIVNGCSTVEFGVFNEPTKTPSISISRVF